MKSIERRCYRRLAEFGDQLAEQTGLGPENSLRLLEMALAWRLLADAGVPVQAMSWPRRWELARSWVDEIFIYPSEWDLAILTGSALLEAVISHSSPVPVEQSLTFVHQLALDHQGEGRARARRTKGSYYTPRLIVDQLLENSLAPWINNWKQCWCTADPVGQELLRSELAALRVMDPACGAGAFLIAAWERLIACWQMAGDPHPARSALQNLVGWEQDCGAVAILRVIIVARLYAAGDQEIDLPLSLIIGDYLQCLPSDEEKVQVIVGNPPWVRAKYALHGSGDGRPARLSTLRRQFPELAVGELNLYTLFISHALDWLRPGGCLSFITPSSFLLDRNSEGLRRRLLSSYRIRELVLLTERESRQLFGGISQASVMLTVEREAYPSGRGAADDAQQLWLQLPHAQMVAGSAMEIKLLQRLLSNPTLAERFTIQDGELHLTRGRGLIEEQAGEGTLPLVRGHDLSCGAAQGRSYVRLDDSLRERWRALIAGRRILLQRIANQHRRRRLKGVIVRGVVAGNSTVALIPKGEGAEYWLPATLKLLHSDLYQWMLMKMSNDNNIPAWKLKLLPWLPSTAVAAETETDAINRLIYELYGLSDEERLLIEGALGK